MPKTALIITHAATIFDKSMSAKSNIEEFISLHPDVNVIRLKSPEHDDYINIGDVIESDYGILKEEEAKSIVSAHDKIITAGGYFNFCALRTYNCLLAAYFNENPLEIVVPMSLLYIPETDFRNCEIYPKRSYTIEELIKASKDIYKGRLKWHMRQRSINLENFAGRAKINQNDKFLYYMPNKELIVKNNGLKLVGLVSHKQVKSK